MFLTVFVFVHKHVLQREIHYWNTQGTFWNPAVESVQNTPSTCFMKFKIQFLSVRNRQQAT